MKPAARSKAAARPSGPDPSPRLTLYVAGDSPPSRRARVNLAAALAGLDIALVQRTVDVLVEPEEALAERIYVTPALLLQVGGQREMVVGDLSQHDTVVLAMSALVADGLPTNGRPT